MAFPLRNIYSCLQLISVEAVHAVWAQSLNNFLYVLLKPAFKINLQW